jgi:hypothetical protein
MVSGLLVNRTFAQDVPDFENWSDEWITHWEDSIKRILYPDLGLGVSSVMPAQKAVLKAAATVTNNTYVPDKVTVSTGASVGEIPFSSNVSPTGSVTVSVPVDVYSGIRGMQPQIAITYSHNAGNSALGAGWNLSGIPAITRANRSIYYDGATQGIALNKTDAFFLDGVRLLKISETSSEIK